MIKRGGAIGVQDEKSVDQSRNLSFVVTRHSPSKNFMKIHHIHSFFDSTYWQANKDSVEGASFCMTEAQSLIFQQFMLKNLDHIIIFIFALLFPFLLLFLSGCYSPITLLVAWLLVSKLVEFRFFMIVRDPIVFLGWRIVQSPCVFSSVLHLVCLWVLCGYHLF